MPQAVQPPTIPRVFSDPSVLPDGEFLSRQASESGIVPARPLSTYDTYEKIRDQVLWKGYTVAVLCGVANYFSITRVATDAIYGCMKIITNYAYINIRKLLGEVSLKREAADETEKIAAIATHFIITNFIIDGSIRAACLGVAIYGTTFLGFPMGLGSAIKLSAASFPFIFIPLLPKVIELAKITFNRATELFDEIEGGTVSPSEFFERYLVIIGPLSIHDRSGLRKKERTPREALLD